MNGSKILMVVSIVLACGLGFFAGAYFTKTCPMKANCEKNMMPPPPPGFDGKGPHGPKGPMGHGPKGFDFEKIDSLLQVTPEQKTALEKQREDMKAGFKKLREEKMEAEKALKEALDGGDPEQINTAKNKVLEAQKAMMDLRIEGATGLAKILSKDQMEKMKAFHKEQQEKFRNHHPGPKDR